MKIYVMEDYQKLSAKAAQIVSSQVTLKNNTVLGLATGSTPEGMYQKLIEMYDAGSIDFSEVTTFNLDEYLGLDPDHPQSYHYYMHHKFFNYVNIPSQNIHIPPGQENNTAETCRNYEQKIFNAGGIDLQILGIGVNGHIGFNEPAKYLNTQTHVVNLSAETISANSRFFSKGSEVPRQAITMGMGSIMLAQKVILLASGKSKAEAIKETVNGKITTEVPASFLQLHHEFILIADKEAAAYI